MRRLISLILCAAFLAASPPFGTRAFADRGTDPSPQGADAPRRRDTKGIVAWSGSLLLSGVALSLAYSEMGNYRDLGREAESRGEDPETFYRSYDRMGWIATTAGLGAILSSVMLLKATHGHEAAPARPLLPPAIPWPPTPEKEAPPPARIAETGAAAAPAAEDAPKLGLEAHDPIGQTIGELEAGRFGTPAVDPAAPVVTQKVTTRQAWLPGTKPDTASGNSAAPSGPDSLRSVATAAGAAMPKPAPSDSAQAVPPPPVVTQKVTTQVAWLPGTEPQAGPATGSAPQSETSATGSPAAPAITPSSSSAAVAAPAGVAPEGAEKPFSLHVGSHRGLSNATNEAGRWRALGYSMHVVPKDLGEKGKWYRVFIGEFATAAEAKAFLATFQQEFPGQYVEILRR